MSETIHKTASCKDDYDPDSITPDKALENIFNAITPVNETESVFIRESLGRVIASDIKSEINVPSGINSAMDGYAIKGSDIPAHEIKKLKLIGTCLAGKNFLDTVNEGECVRIMTGAIMPEGTDTVVIQEQAIVAGEYIDIGNDTKPGDNVRQAGEDLSIGDLVLEKGMRVTPAEIGLLASLGQAKVSVFKNIKVAFFSTGDELRSVGEVLDDGAIYDSNRYTLFGMLARIGVEIIDMGVVRDDKELLDRAFIEAAEEADVIITSGGVSVGDADYIKEILEKQGTVDFWKVAMKPGRPLTFGKINNTLFFGLPGNPVSVMVTFYQFVQPALKRLLGETVYSPITMKAPCVSNLKKRPGRVEYQRGVLEQDETGSMVVRKTGKQGSGILRSMADANCFIVLPMENEGVKEGEMVDVQLFHGIV
ncbi:MAG: molybdopterin molybdotransferase MoeA [Proteobacteria bacterium]|nr:molybdopterin molybdenumtransferase MoeA [Pseudomonadota bacterium]NOG60888.1 molybdopterin molybdotransferase MoeA [Pseudomonadota bacterium]